MKRRCGIITGPIDSGKSTYLKTLIESAIQDGRTVGGIRAESLLRSDHKYGYDVEDLKTGDCRPLLREKKEWGGSIEKDDQLVGRFILFKSGLHFAEQALRSAVDEPADLICIDELGPLEAQGGGYAQVLSELIEKYNGELLIVVREELEAYFTEKLRDYGWKTERRLPPRAGSDERAP